MLGAYGPDGEVRLNLRLDLPSGGQVPAAVGGLAAAGCTLVSVVGYGPGPLVDPEVALVREVAGAKGIKVGEALRVEEGRYWSCLCGDPAHCPPEGTAYATAGNPVTAAFEAHGGPAPLASRDALAATVAPVGGDEAEAMARATGRAIRRGTRLGRREARRRAGGAGQLLGGTAAYRAVAAAIATYRQGGSITGPDELAWLGCALADVRVRDAAWRQMDPGRARAHQRLWTDLARAGQGSLAAAPACLLAYCAWQGGDHALASIALDRADDSQPGYPLAATLRETVGRTTFLAPGQRQAFVDEAFRVLAAVDPFRVERPA
jgi:hypothetical protein